MPSRPVLNEIHASRITAIASQSPQTAHTGLCASCLRLHSIQYRGVYFFCSKFKSERATPSCVQEHFQMCSTPPKHRNSEISPDTRQRGLLPVTCLSGSWLFWCPHFFYRKKSYWDFCLKLHIDHSNSNTAHP